MKKILLICFCCLCLCGCEEKKQMLECTMIENKPTHNENIHYYIFYDDNGKTNKICTNQIITFDTIENAINYYQLYEPIYKNISLNKTTITIDNDCNDNPVEKETIEENIQFYEQIGYECTIKDAN